MAWRANIHRSVANSIHGLKPSIYGSGLLGEAVLGAMMMMFSPERHLPILGQHGHSPQRHTAAGTVALSMASNHLFIALGLYMKAM